MCPCPACHLCPQMGPHLLRMHFPVLYHGVPRPPHAKRCVRVQKIHRQLKERGVETGQMQHRNCGHSQEEGHVELRTSGSVPDLIGKARGASLRKVQG